MTAKSPGRTGSAPPCLQHCLLLPRHTVTSTIVASPEVITETIIPTYYQTYREVFSKDRASGLPPHRPYNYTIDLLPGTIPAQCRIYPLTTSEQQAMKEYIQEALKQGYICPSKSPALVRFFFMEKKGRGLRTGIDYGGLNLITVKYPYPLPLVLCALEQLHSAQIFTKLNLCSMYNFMHMHEGNEWKMAFSTVSVHYEYCVMPYGLAHPVSLWCSGTCSGSLSSPT